MATPEQRASESVALAAPSLGVTLMRNNSGQLLDRNGRPVRYGLGNDSKRINDRLKSSDYIGWTEVTITPEMVGKTVAVFTAIEVKSNTFKHRDKYPEGSREWGQMNFINLGIKHGAFGGICRSGEDLAFYINYFKEWLTK